MTQLEYSGAHKGVMRAGGHAAHRRDARGGDDWAGVEYTAPAGHVLRGGGHPITARRPATADTARPWKPSPPSLGVYGPCVPYGVALDGGQHGRLIFDTRTRWLIDTDLIPLKLEHFGLLGTVDLDETPAGLYAHATVYPERRHAFGTRTHLSPGLTILDTEPGADGTHAVTRARLNEVSLTLVPRWAGHTHATIWQRPAA